MPANVESMAYYGEVPWHGMGTSVEQDVTAEEMIAAAGLDWDVDVRPARGAKIDRKGRASRYEVVRCPRPGRDEEEVLFGVVTKCYTPPQNRDAFRFFDPIVEGKEAYFETAGALGQGERIWVMGRMPGSMEVVPGDECRRYLLLSNTHDGQGAIAVKFTPIRVVCENTLMIAMKDGQRAFRVRHSQLMHERLEDVSELIGIARELFDRHAVIFEGLAQVGMTESRLNEYLDRVYPRSEKHRQRGTMPDRWDHVRELLETHESLQLEKVRGTLWAAYNAITRFEDYKQGRSDDDPDGRLERIWFGSGAENKLKALEAAKEMAGAA